MIHHVFDTDPTSTANEVVGIFILAVTVLPILFGIPFALGWLLDRKAPCNEGPRIVACILIAEIWTLLILGFAGLIAVWTHLIVFPPALALVIGGYFGSRWRSALNRKNALFAGSDGGAEHWATIVPARDLQVE